MLRRLTSLPSAAGREHQVVAFVEKWLRSRRALTLRRDRCGNLMIQRRTLPRTGKCRPLVIEAHMDHPAFVVTEIIDDHCLGADFRGGVEACYFVGSAVRLHQGKGGGTPPRGVIRTIDSRQGRFDDHYVTIRFPRPVAAEVGDVLTWDIDPARIQHGRLHALACDNLAGVAAALTTFDVLLQVRSRAVGDVRVLLTRAEEVGFVGAMAAARSRFIPKDAAIVVLECSKALADAPVGAGPIVRVGDKTHCFSPEITYALGHIAADLASRDKRFHWQRKLMTGGTCNASAYHSLGHHVGCLCLPLGNYHNMGPVSPDGRRRAERGGGRIAPEIISVADWHHLVSLLMETALTFGRGGRVPDFTDVLDQIFAARRHLLS